MFRGVAENARQQADVLGRRLQHVHFTGLTVSGHHWNDPPQVGEHAVQTAHLAGAPQDRTGQDITLRTSVCVFLSPPLSHTDSNVFQHHNSLTEKG